MKGILGVSLLLTFVVACTNGPEKITQEDRDLLKTAQNMFEPLPDSIIDKVKFAEKIKLGEKLYFDTNLSKTGTISCNSCHLLEKFGVDNQKTSPGHNGTLGTRNSPTVYNAALHSMQFWDGRAKDVEEQALGPILNPIEMGMLDEDDALTRIKSKEYAAMFKRAYPKDKSPSNFKNMGNAIGAFERTLLTPSRFDDYLKGDITALSQEERRGLRKFVEVGCTTCHAGVGIGGNMFQKLGLVKAYETKDQGLYELTKKRRDKNKFKVPGLRNIEKTGPYFHDGSIASLDEAVDIMAEYQLGKKLKKSEVQEISAFLSSLTAKKLPY